MSAENTEENEDAYFFIVLHHQKPGVYAVITRGNERKEPFDIALYKTPEDAHAAMENHSFAQAFGYTVLSLTDGY